MPSQGVTNVANAIINKINSLISSHNSNSNAHQDIRNNIPSASSTVPSADTTNGSVGDGTTWARSNHTHPKSSLYAEASHTHSLDTLRYGNDFNNGWESISLFTQDNDYKTVDMGGLITLDYSNNQQKATYKTLREYEKSDDEIATIDDIDYTIDNYDFGLGDLAYLDDISGNITSENIDGYVGTVALSNDYDDLDNKPSIPVNTSDLNNDSGFITSSSVPSASSTTPSADTTNGSVGDGTTWARSNHTHPKSSLYAEASHTHNTTEIRDSSAYNRIGSGANDTQANINDSIDLALANIDDNILYTKMDLVGLDKFQVKDFINPNNWAIPGCTYSNGVLTFSGTNSFTTTFPTDFELNFDYIIDDGLVLGDTFYFYIFGRETNYTVTEEDINNGYVIIDVSFRSENNHGIITSEQSGDKWSINDVGSLNPYTINAITPVGNSTKIANIRYKANNIISLNDNKEDVYNKVTSLSSSSTDTQYPSAKAVYDAVNEATINAPTNKNLITTSFTPSKLIKDSNGETINNYNSFTLVADGIPEKIIGGYCKFDFGCQNNEYYEFDIAISKGDADIYDSESEESYYHLYRDAICTIKITHDELIVHEIDIDETTVIDLSNSNGILTFITKASICQLDFSNKKWYHEATFFDKVYPIGSVHITTNSVNPSNYFDGEWERIQDTFLLASGATYENGATGGSATVTLTAAQSGVPQHTHTYAHTDTTYKANTTSRKPGTSTAANYVTSITGTANNTTKTSNNNNAQNAAEAHNNMPPYLAVYMWERVG